jgi:hypothetical protein
VIEVPAAAYRAPIHVAAIALVSAILFFTLVSVLAGRLAGSRLTRAVKGLANPSLPAPGPLRSRNLKRCAPCSRKPRRRRRPRNRPCGKARSVTGACSTPAPVAIGVFCEDKGGLANPAAVRMFGAEIGGPADREVDQGDPPPRCVRALAGPDGKDVRRGNGRIPGRGGVCGSWTGRRCTRS